MVISEYCRRIFNVLLGGKMSLQCKVVVVINLNIK